MNKETMTSRERVLNAINHKPVDRMPIDLGIHFSTGISIYAYQNLREYLGMPINDLEMIDCVQCLARVDTDIIERFHIDTMLLNPSWNKKHVWNPYGKYQFIVPTTFQPVQRSNGGWDVNYNNLHMYMPKGGFFFDGAWPNFYDMSEDEQLNCFADNAERIYKETDKFTMYMGFSAYFDGIDFACDMLTDPEDCKDHNEKLLSQQIEKFDKINSKFGKYIGAIEVNGDLGMQNAPMCSPESYEECCYPFLKRFCDHVHSTSNIKIFMHCCGSIYRLLSFIVDAGVDVINPVQISAAEMDPQKLKAEFGNKICFWGGGCETQSVLWSKTPAEISAHVKELVNIFKTDSGFVFNQVHNIMGNVPAANIVAMLDAAYENAW